MLFVPVARYAWRRVGSRRAGSVVNWEILETEGPFCFGDDTNSWPNLVTDGRVSLRRTNRTEVLRISGDVVSGLMACCLVRLALFRCRPVTNKRVP